MINVLQFLLFRLPSFGIARKRREYALNPVSGTTLRLQNGEVIGLAKSSGVTRLEVRRGLVWLTGTPGGMDVLLRCGQGCDLTGNWPVVVEALESTDMILERGGRKSAPEKRGQG